MARFRRESHHSDGITDQISLQRTSATKSALNGHASCDEAAKTAWRIVANIAKLPSLLRQYHSLTGRSRDVRYGGIRDHRAAAMIGHHRSDECR
jgi:hypothetical protein